MPFPGSPLPLSTVLALAQSVAPRVLKKFPVTTPGVLARAITALARQESQFYPRAYNGWTGQNEAIGLTQILPETQQTIESWLGLPHDRAKLYDPEYALLLGATYLAYQYQRYHDWERAIYSYYTGSYPGAVRHQAGARAYVQAVLRYYAGFWGSDPETDEKNGLSTDVTGGDGSGLLVMLGLVVMASMGWLAYCYL